MPADVGRRSVSPEGEFTLGTSTVTETSSAGDVTPGRPLQSCRFQVKIGDEWKDSEASEDKLLKQLLRDGHEVVKITLRGQRLEYDFRALEQRNITRGTVRPIRLPKDWVDMEEWAEDRRALAQPGGPRSGAAAPPPTPRAMSPSAARLSSAPQSPHAPRTPPLEGVREASRPRARSPADSPYHDLMRHPATSPRRRRPTRECCLAVSHMEEQQKKRTSGVPCTPDRRPSTARQMSFSARAPEVNSSRRAKDGRLSARVAELEEILRTTKESGEHFASLSLTQLHQLTARTQQLEEHLRTTKEGGSQKASTGKRPKQKPPDKGSQGARAPGICSSSDCLGAEAPGRPALSDEQDQATSTSSSSFATSDSDEPTQRNASQAGLLAMVLKLEAQLAASRAENEQLCEIISRTTSGAGIAPQEGKEEERQEEDLRLQASPASRSSEARVAAPPQAPSTPPGRASSPDLCALGTPQRTRLPSGATPLRLPRVPPCAATTPPKARPRCSSLWGSPGRSPVGGVATPVRRASFFSCLQTPEHGCCPDGSPRELGRPSCHNHNSRSSLGRIYLPAWRGHYLSLPRALKNSFDEVAEDAAQKNACPLDGAPVPPLGESWDWPLSRQERKERATFLDRQVLMADQRSLMEHIEGIRKSSRSTRGSTQAPVPSLVLSPSLDTDSWED